MKLEKQQFAVGQYVEHRGAICKIIRIAENPVDATYDKRIYRIKFLFPTPLSRMPGAVNRGWEQDIYFHIAHHDHCHGFKLITLVSACHARKQLDEFINSIARNE